MGCDGCTARGCCPPSNFNPRTRMGCDLRTHKKINQKTKFQSTHPHGVRLRINVLHVLRGDISIHAPAWGATIAIASKLQVFRISIHAPAWGATCTASRWCGFNMISIHAPAWGATLSRCIKPPYSNISIHAPAWGATLIKKIKRRAITNFNPRTRMGCDGPERTNRGLNLSFQSTHPHGVRHIRQIRRTYRPYFNPRTRMGCDKADIR